MTSTSNSKQAAQQQNTFEFTKRKRWADLLITELAEAVIFVLSSTGKVLYCGQAITELLGWKDTDLVDHPLYEIINPQDHDSFRASFNESVKEESELLSYVHLICKDKFISGPDYETSPKQVLFEFKGYPHFVTDQDLDPACYFAVARPYPSRNTQVLNTFLELKMENERLQQRVNELRANGFKGQSSALYPSATAPASSSSSMVPPPTSGDYYDLAVPLSINTPSGTRNGFDSTMQSPARAAFGGSGGPFSSSSAGAGPSTGPFSTAPSPLDEEPEDGGKKKKSKKTHSTEQHVCVTCGRTDSPEWRKGPLGPKTLCNACGLRWAKQMRKPTDDPSGDNDC